MLSGRLALLQIGRLFYILFCAVFCVFFHSMQLSLQEGKAQAIKGQSCNLTWASDTPRVKTISHSVTFNPHLFSSVLHFRICNTFSCNITTKKHPSKLQRAFCHPDVMQLIQEANNKKRKKKMLQKKKTFCVYFPYKSSAMMRTEFPRANTPLKGINILHSM